ncbi:4-alpha-glucanotransferase [Anaerolineales bacterium]
MPLGPTSYGDSPYQTLSAFAGNPNLISLDNLIGEGWLKGSDLTDCPRFPIYEVDYGWVIQYHDQKLKLAYRGLKKLAKQSQIEAFESFCEKNDFWLKDFALFIALKNAHGSRAWIEWDKKYILRDEKALAQATQEFADQIEEEKFRQWVFFTQWFKLKAYANEKGIQIFGDMPIFVAHDSADVWANQSEYFLDELGNTTVIAGVPPDYFSLTGQRWGNPLYQWDKMKENGYAWWIQRIQSSLELVDYVRVDHFRGFDEYWEIPAEEETAIKGEWKTGPKHDFFHKVYEQLGDLPFIAEDLGIITPGVEALRDDFNLPGMKVLQFAWSTPDNVFLPHNHVPNCVVYTGTHDNNTTLGWWIEEAGEQRNFMKDYLGQDIQEPVWTMIRVALRSPAHTAIIPMQDVLGFGSDTRMNTPGKLGGNWKWRFHMGEFDNPNKDILAHLTWLSQRRPDQRERHYGDPAVVQD